MSRFVCLSLLLLGCEPAPKAGTASLDGDAVASVGGELVSAGLVRRVSEETSASPREALGRAIEDALLALEATRRLPSGTREMARRQALTRALLERLKEETSRPAVTDDEVAGLRARRWLELDRPSAARVLHAFVRVPPDDPDARSLAREVMAQVRRAVAGVESGKEFIEKAKPFVVGERRVETQALPPVAADGRVVTSPPGTFEKRFAAAANALKSPGDVSGVVETTRAVHVLYLVERLPGDRAPRAAVEQLVLAERGGEARQRLLQRLRASARLDRARNRADLTMKIELD